MQTRIGKSHSNYEIIIYQNMRRRKHFGKAGRCRKGFIYFDRPPKRMLLKQVSFEISIVAKKYNNAEISI